jgi:predicted house-cleaning NTP pyrophosphatase (Maf/HAM1 superfamily)
MSEHRKPRIIRARERAKQAHHNSLPSKMAGENLATCDTIADVDGERDGKPTAADRQLELIERQLFNLIGQVKTLKNLITT